MFIDVVFFMSSFLWSCFLCCLQFFSWNSNNLIYPNVPNVLLTYNINAGRTMLQCPCQLAREGSVASKWCNTSLWHYSHMPAMLTMMDLVLPALSWMLSLCWWVSVQAQQMLVFMNILFRWWLLLLILLMAQLIEWNKIMVKSNQCLLVLSFCGRFFDVVFNFFPDIFFP